MLHVLSKVTESFLSQTRVWTHYDYVDHIPLGAGLEPESPRQHACIRNTVHYDVTPGGCYPWDIAWCICTLVMNCPLHCICLHPPSVEAPAYDWCWSTRQIIPITCNKLSLWSYLLNFSVLSFSPNSICFVYAIFIVISNLFLISMALAPPRQGHS